MSGHVFLQGFYGGQQAVTDADRLLAAINGGSGPGIRVSDGVRGTRRPIRVRWPIP